MGIVSSIRRSGSMKLPESDRVTVQIILDKHNVLQELHIEGHAGAMPQGQNVACGAVSLLAKTAYEALREFKDIPLCGNAPEPGKLWFKLVSYTDEYQAQLQGMTSFLIKGFTVLQREFPTAVYMVIHSTGG